MKTPPYPANEAERIKVLRDLLILDTDPEGRFDAVTAYCHSRFKAEIALVSLVDSDRQWFKSSCGLAARQTPREISFCGHAILHDEVLVVKDTLCDERFFDNPLVVGPPHIRFYAGAPLRLSSGYNVGTLCIISSRLLILDPEEVEHLKVLAHMVAMELENQGRIQHCAADGASPCLYGELPQECGYKHTKHELPES